MIRALELSDAAEAPVDEIHLAYSDRYRRRGRMTALGGLEVMLDLAETTELPDGGALVLEDGRHVAVRAAQEPLARVQGANLARLAWHVGNRHTPCQVAADHLLIQRDHVLEDMLRGLGAVVSHVHAPFRPEGGAYGHGRTHAHAHAHHAHDDPNAHIPHRHG